MLEPVFVVSLGVVGAGVGAAALLANDCAGDDGLGAIEHEPQLEVGYQVVVEDFSFVANGGFGVALLELDEGLLGLFKAVGVPEDSYVRVHGLAHCESNRGGRVAVGIPLEYGLDTGLFIGLDGVGKDRLAKGGGVFGGGEAGASAKDDGFQQGVGPEPVASVEADAGAFASGVETREWRLRR